MSGLAKCRRVKRPTTIAKRSQLAKKNFYEKRSYKPLCEKLKGNNNALAKALSREKQEGQYLLSQNLSLKSEVQELGVACNKRDDIISVALRNAKETLALLVTLTSHVTNTIACCQQVVTTTRFTQRKSATAERRESTRRSSGKSPARGVVQPMVGGHTITKPTINLSRLNIQREYRIQNSPNLSDIEEISTSEQSPSGVQASSIVRSPISRTLNCVPRRVDRMPERLQCSPRTSDESERRSSVRSNRNSSRNSPRRSRRDSGEARADAQNDERLKSPRVSLHDVSRLLQNAQSVNIRTLLESLNEGETSQSDQACNVTLENSSSSRPDNSPEAGTTRSESSRCERTSPDLGDVSRNERDNSAVVDEAEDPLEGPSWLLNDHEVASSLEDAVTTRPDDLSTIEPRGKKKERKIRAGNGNWKNHRGLKERKIEDPSKDEEEQEEEEEDEDETVNLANRWSDPRGRNFYQHLTDEDDRTETILPNFVTRKRGSHCDDTEDFTLMWRGPTATNRHFGINDLELPVIDSPLRKQPEVRPPEPELTANIQRITTQNFGNLTAFTAPINNNNNNNDTIADGGKLPILPDNEITLGCSSIVEQNERSDDEPGFDDTDDAIVPRPRKKRPIVLDTSNDSDWTPTPKRKNLRAKRKDSGKDPSSAKVVLRKLKDDRIIGKLSLTSDPQNSPGNHDNRHTSGTSMYGERSSDSEASSNASFNNSVINAEVHGRPRRQKAPTSLKEPSLGKKLRRP